MKLKIVKNKHRRKIEGFPINLFCKNGAVKHWAQIRTCNRCDKILKKEKDNGRKHYGINMWQWIGSKVPSIIAFDTR
jgi:hypothetical protein